MKLGVKLPDRLRFSSVPNLDRQAVEPPTEITAVIHCHLRWNEIAGSARYRRIQPLFPSPVGLEGVIDLFGVICHSPVRSR